MREEQLRQQNNNNTYIYIYIYISHSKTRTQMLWRIMGPILLEKTRPQWYGRWSDWWWPLVARSSLAPLRRAHQPQRCLCRANRPSRRRARERGVHETPSLCAERMLVIRNRGVGMVKDNRECAWSISSWLELDDTWEHHYRNEPLLSTHQPQGDVNFCRLIYPIGDPRGTRRPPRTPTAPNREGEKRTIWRIKLIKRVGVDSPRGRASKENRCQICRACAQNQRKKKQVDWHILWPARQVHLCILAGVPTAPTRESAFCFRQPDATDYTHWAQLVLITRIKMQGGGGESSSALFL